MKKKRVQAEQKSIVLPEQLLFVEQEKYADIIEDIDLVEEEKWEYLTQMHKNIDRSIDCSRPLHVRYGDNFQPRKATVQQELRFFESDSESEEVDQIEQAAERLASLVPKMVSNEAPIPKSYPAPWIPRTKTEKTIDLVCKRAQASTLYELGSKAGLHLNSVGVGERESAVIVDDTYEFKLID